MWGEGSVVVCACVWCMCVCVCVCVCVCMCMCVCVHVCVCGVSVCALCAFGFSTQWRRWPAFFVLCKPFNTSPIDSHTSVGRAGEWVGLYKCAVC